MSKIKSIEMEQNPFWSDEARPDPRDSKDAIDLTAPMFFGDSDYQAVFTRQEFISFGKSLRTVEALDFKTCVNCTNERMRMSGHRRKRKDRGNREYAYLSFYQPNGPIETKVILEQGMERFLDDYHRGKISVKFTFDELLAESKLGI